MDEIDSLFVNDRLSLPLSELDFRFTTGGGPGGQHVNRSATRVTLRFDVARSPSLDDETRARLLSRLANRLDREGVLQFSVQESRSQFQNRQIALERLRNTLGIALVEEKPRRATRPGRSAVEERLAEKRRRAIAKRERRGNWRDLD